MGNKYYYLLQLLGYRGNHFNRKVLPGNQQIVPGIVMLISSIDHQVWYSAPTDLVPGSNISFDEGQAISDVKVLE